MSNEYHLTEAILALSDANIWDDAKLEWELDYIYFDDDLQTCLCTHYPIKEICVLRNKINKNNATVGNCCVKKFIGLPSDLIFSGVKRVQENEEKALNEEAILHGYKQGWINDYEYKFCLSTKRKRVLSEKQRSKRIQINRKFLVMMKKRTSRS